ncbi:contactin-associated protein-like 2 [Diadema setosum]|uniref:contactin-associated protein-like 2 n=1 Tax=Diadema setosum TaxID=31175 RepID=UPI003B3A0866
MEKVIMICSALFAIFFMFEYVKGQTYTVQDIADMQNQVMYEMFDYFHFSQERQLTTAFEKLKTLEARMLQVERALGLDAGDAAAVPGFVRPTALYVPDPLRRENYRERKRPQASHATAFPRRHYNGRVTPAPPRPPTWAPIRPEPTIPPSPTQPPYARTCAEIYKMGLLSDQEPLYSVDPLRNGNLVNVVCERETRKDGTTAVYTVVGHSQMRSLEVSGYEEPGLFSLDPKYDASKKQLKALTALSQSCSQRIAYRCRGSVLMVRSDATRTTYAWWVTIDGDRVESWGGAPINSTMCACGTTRSCMTGRPCNCDSNGKGADVGDITQKEYLPVMDVRLGDTGGKREMGYIQLGALRCEG